MNGLFNINKPLGVSSAKAIWLLKQKLNIKDKIGHMGTLDPFATGVLIVGVGRANRLFDVMLEKVKTYVATFEFGYQTETLDRESSNILFTSNKIPTQDEIKSVLPSMLGKSLQIAPSYSAKSINGTRAYMFARQGKQVEIKPHSIEIYKFNLIKQQSNTTFVFEIECSKGTYIRSICRDLAEKLGTYATMTALERTKCGNFLIENSKTLEEVTENDIIKNDFVLTNFKTLELSDLEIQKIRNGQKVEINEDVGEYKVYQNSCLIGIAKVDENKNVKIKTWLI